MKILITFYEICDPGGIINHNENLVAGLRELGHEVCTRLLVWREDTPRQIAGGKGSISTTALQYDQRRGYTWPHGAIIPYKGRENIKRWREYAEQFDLIIWQIAVPTKRKENYGNTDWLSLYRLEHPRQIAVIHDGNFLDSYPWLYAVTSQLDGLACVHHCAYNSASYIGIPSRLILNPQQIGALPDISQAGWARRRPGFLSLQTFKAWKHVPQLCRAMPYAGPIQKTLAGCGIDYYYLTSKDKCKYPGVWDAALESGMDYIGVITNNQRDEILKLVTALVDPSWSKKYGAIGGHFNRVIVDAIKMGAVPITTGLGISNNRAGNGELFVHNQNVMCIPHDVDDAQYGYLLHEYCTLPYHHYHRIMEGALQLLPLFDRRHVAGQFVDMALHPEKCNRGKLTDNVFNNGAHALATFFNAR